MPTNSHPPRVTLPTRITIARILAIPFFILLVVYYQISVGEGRADDVLRWAATGLFVLACATDALDGHLARSRGLVSRLGRVLDPLADKALLLSALVLLTGPWGRAFAPHIPVWYVLLVLSRDVILIAGGMLIHHMTGALEVRPSWTGKGATALQMVVILWVLTSYDDAFFMIAVRAAGALVLASAVQYVAAGVRQLEKTHVHDG